jgi:hypothetical protein
VIDAKQQAALILLISCTGLGHLQAPASKSSCLVWHAWHALATHQESRSALCAYVRAMCVPCAVCHSLQMQPDLMLLTCTMCATLPVAGLSIAWIFNMTASFAPVAASMCTTAPERQLLKPGLRNTPCENGRHEHSAATCASLTHDMLTHVKQVAKGGGRSPCNPAAATVQRLHKDGAESYLEPGAMHLAVWLWQQRPQLHLEQ